MLDALDKGANIWQCLLAAFFPGYDSVNVSNELFNDHDHNFDKDSKSCLTNLAKVYAVLAAAELEYCLNGEHALCTEKDDSENDHAEVDEDEKASRRDRGLAFCGSTPKVTASFMDFIPGLIEDQSLDDFLNMFYLLNIGLLSTDQEVRCGTLVVATALFRNVPGILIAKDYEKMFSDFICAFLQSNCFALIIRCLDLSADPRITKEAECIEVLRFYQQLLRISQLNRPDVLIPAIASSLGSVVRDYITVFGSENDDTSKRKEMIKISCLLSNLVNADTGKGRGMGRRPDLLNTENYPAGMVAKTSAILIAEMLMVNPTPVCKSGAITVLISFILHSSNQRLTESILSSILYVINFSESRSQISPIMLHSFMSPFTSESTSGFKFDLSMPFSEESFGSAFQIQLQSSKLCLISLLSSWQGLIALGSPVSRNSSALKSGVEILICSMNVGDVYCRTAVLETLYHVLGIEFPTNFSFLLSENQENLETEPNAYAVPNDSYAKYRLDEGFVVAEFVDSRDCFSDFRDNQPSQISAKTLDLVLSRRVFLLAAFVEAGLIDMLQKMQESIYSVETKDERTNMENSLKLAAAYMLVELCQVYKPLLPKHFEPFFSAIAFKAEGDLTYDSETDPEIIQQLEKFNVSNETQAFLDVPFEPTETTRNERGQSEGSINVLDAIVKWKRQRQTTNPSSVGPQCGIHGSVFMEYLRNEQNSSLISTDLSTALIPKANSKKLEHHLAQLLVESNVLEQTSVEMGSHVENSEDSTYEFMNMSNFPSTNESEDVLENSLALVEAVSVTNLPQRQTSRVSIADPLALFKAPFWTGRAPNVKESVEVTGSDTVMTDVTSCYKLYSWPTICSCLRHFSYKYETGIATSAARAGAFLIRLTLYFMPSSRFFSAEKYSYSASAESSSGDFFAKIEAGSLLFKLLADAYVNAESTPKTSTLGASTPLVNRIAHMAKMLFADLFSCIETEYPNSAVTSGAKTSRGSRGSTYNARRNNISVFGAIGLPESCAQLYFIFLGGLPMSSRRSIMNDFHLTEAFVNILIFGKNEPLCKLILTCVPYNKELGSSESCQMMELAVRGSSSKTIQQFAIQLLQILVGFWRDASRVVAWKEHGVKKLAWVIDMLFEAVFNPDDVIKDIAFNQLLDISVDNRCLPLMFSNDRQLALLLVQPDPVLLQFQPGAERTLNEMVHLKSVCLFSRYLNCSLETELSAQSPLRQRTFSETDLFSTTMDDLPDCTDGISELLADYSRKTKDSVLYKVLVKTWCNEHFCSRYAQYVDSLANENFCRHQTSHDGKFIRTSSSGSVKKARTAVLPPHLFRELCETEKGARFFFSLAKDTISHHINHLGILKPSKHQLVEVKAAIWSIAHIASTSCGFNRLPTHAVVLLALMAEESEVLSLRGTALTSLSLLCRDALKLLKMIGWSHDKQCESYISTSSTFTLFEDLKGFEVDHEIGVMCKKFCKQIESTKFKKRKSQGSFDPLKHTEAGKKGTLRKFAMTNQTAEKINEDILAREARKYSKSESPAVVLPVRMKRIMNVRNFNSLRAKRGSSSEGYRSGRDTRNSSLSGYERRETVDSNEERSSFDRESSDISIMASESAHNKRYSTGCSVPSYPATPVNRPRLLTVSYAMDAGIVARNDSIDGVRFSVESPKGFDNAVRDERSSSNDSNNDAEWLEKIVILVHEEEKCLQCKCFSALYALKMTNFSEVSSNFTRLNVFASRDESPVYVPRMYREKFLFWAGQLCSITSKDAATNMENFMKKFVYGLLKNATNPAVFDPVETDRYENSQNYEKVEMHKLVCLYSDCLLVLNQNACSAANRLFVHTLFSPIVNEQLTRLRQTSGISNR